MQVFDASSMIHAWDNYPLQQFPPLWEWMETQIVEKTIVMPCVAFDEIAHVAPSCAEWLKSDIEQLEMTNEIMQEAIRIKTLLCIEGDHYGTGVGENDIFIIASARIHRSSLISNEARPRSSKRYSKVQDSCRLRHERS